jgi:hypothetical protein
MRQAYLVGVLIFLGSSSDKVSLSLTRIHMRCRVSAFLGHGPAIPSTRLHGNAAAATDADGVAQINFMYCDKNKVADISIRTKAFAYDYQQQRMQQWLQY